MIFLFSGGTLVGVDCPTALRLTESVTATLSGSAGATRWFRTQPLDHAQYTVSIPSGFELKLYRGTGCGSLTLDQTLTAASLPLGPFLTDLGEVLWLAVRDQASSGSAFAVQYDWYAAYPDNPGEACATALALTDGVPRSDAVTGGVTWYAYTGGPWGYVSVLPGFSAGDGAVTSVTIYAGTCESLTTLATGTTDASYSPITADTVYLIRVQFTGSGTLDIYAGTA